MSAETIWLEYSPKKIAALPIKPVLQRKKTTSFLSFWIYFANGMCELIRDFTHPTMVTGKKISYEIVVTLSLGEPGKTQRHLQ